MLSCFFFFFLPSMFHTVQKRKSSSSVCLMVRSVLCLPCFFHVLPFFFSFFLWFKCCFFFPSHWTYFLFDQTSQQFPFGFLHAQGTHMHVSVHIAPHYPSRLTRFILIVAVATYLDVVTDRRCGGEKAEAE